MLIDRQGFIVDATAFENAGDFTLDAQELPLDGFNRLLIRPGHEVGSPNFGEPKLGALTTPRSD